MEIVDLNPMLQGCQTDFNSRVSNGLVVYCCCVQLAGPSLSHDTQLMNFDFIIISSVTLVIMLDLN